MKNFILSAFALATASVIAMPVYARDFQCAVGDQTLNFTVVDEDALTCQLKAGSTSEAGNSANGRLVIPETASDGTNTYSVVAIGDYSFIWSEGITAVEVPASVTTIGKGAFYYCPNLTEAQLPENLTEIATRTFGDCTSLTAVNIPASVTAIGESAFEYCSALASLTLPDGLTKIGASAFSGCSALTAIVLPDNVTSISDGAFNGCSALTAVNIPAGLTTLGRMVWYTADNVTEVKYPAESPIELTDRFADRTFAKSVYENATLYLNQNAIEAAKSMKPWSLFSHVEPITTSAIETVTADDNASTEVYTISGVKLDTPVESLTGGIYIIRHGEKVEKVVVK